MTEDDVRRAATYLGLSPKAFEKRYVYRTKHLRRLRKPRGSECSFLEDNSCGIHPANPTQCRTYPFWPEHIESRKAWKSLGRQCPGVGKGELIQIQTMQRVANEMREAYPTMYD